VARILGAIASLPESCILIIFGAIIGGLLLLIDPERKSAKFTPYLFFNVLLPPIIMDSSFAIYNKDFGKNFPTILIFAVAGTIFNIFAIGGGLILVDVAGGFQDIQQQFNATLSNNTLSVLTFTSLISAVDPVAVLAIFQEIGVKVSLYFLVFGESLLNDGVTIVVYNTMVALSTGTPDLTDYIKAFFSFFTVVFGGLLVGIAMGFISTFTVKFTRHCRELEPFIIIVSTYMSFILAELFHWSGIIGILGCGIVQKRYAFRNISKKSFWTIKYGVKTMATFADCVIFIFLGLVSAENLEIWESWNFEFVAMTCFLCTFIRFVGVLVLSFLVNRNAHLVPISLKEQFIMAYGGLRGGVGFSLAQILNNDNPFKNLFLTTAIFMVYFTTFIQGGTIKVLVRLLSIDRAEKKVSRFM
jgi:sodium/hydrogen exchanger 3